MNYFGGGDLITVVLESNPGDLSRKLEDDQESEAALWLAAVPQVHTGDA